MIEAEGKEFDPNFHQAVMTVSDENFKPGMVVEELQKRLYVKRSRYSCIFSKSK